MICNAGGGKGRTPQCRGKKPPPLPALCILACCARTNYFVRGFNVLPGGLLLTWEDLLLLALEAPQELVGLTREVLGPARPEEHEGALERKKRLRFGGFFFKKIFYLGDGPVLGLPPEELVPGQEGGTVAGAVSEVHHDGCEGAEKRGKN